MKQKTPLQELIEKAIAYSRELSTEGHLHESLAVDFIIDQAEALLEKEKEVIENAYNRGQTSYNHPFYGYMGDVYYEETFNTKEK